MMDSLSRPIGGVCKPRFDKKLMESKRDMKRIISFVFNLTTVETDSCYLNYSLVCGRYSMAERGAHGGLELMLIRKKTPADIFPFLVKRYYRYGWMSFANEWFEGN